MILHVTLLLLEEGWLHMTPITHSSRPCLKTLMVLHTGFFTKTNKTSPVAAHQAHPSQGSRFCNTPSTTMGTSQPALVVQPSPWSRLGVSFPTKSLVVWAGERRHQAALSDIHTFHPMDNSPLFPLPGTAAFLQAVALRLRTLHSLKPVIQCLTFTIPFFSCSCYREGSNIFQTGVTWVALGLGGHTKNLFYHPATCDFLTYYENPLS